MAKGKVLFAIMSMVATAILVLACSSGGDATSPADNPSSSDSAASSLFPGGKFTDPRDGRVYRVVTIGSQIWMAENLNYDFSEGSSCIALDTNDCENGKIGIYTWYAALVACPDGWHLPSFDEWNDLFVDAHNISGGGVLTGRLLKAQDGGWVTYSDSDCCDGDDVFGFAVRPAKYTRENVAWGPGQAFFWSATEGEIHKNEAHCVAFDEGDDLAKCTNKDKSRTYSVRCLYSEEDYVASWSNTAAYVSSSQGMLPTSYSSSSAKGNSSSVEVKSSSSSQEPPTMTDSRDGRVYKIVTIGTQTWMAENLNYETEEDWCYDDSYYNCMKYGRLYTWTTATGSTWDECGNGVCDLGTDIVQGICPDGWHLPTQEEWELLLAIVGGSSALRASSGWEKSIAGEAGNGYDTYGFTALPGGSRSDEGNYNNGGDVAFIWSATQSNHYLYTNYANLLALYSFSSNVTLGKLYKGHAASVRCIQD